MDWMHFGGVRERDCRGVAGRKLRCVQSVSWAHRVASALCFALSLLSLCVDGFPRPPRRAVPCRALLSFSDQAVAPFAVCKRAPAPNGAGTGTPLDWSARRATRVEMTREPRVLTRLFWHLSASRPRKKGHVAVRARWQRSGCLLWAAVCVPVPSYRDDPGSRGGAAEMGPARPKTVCFVLVLARQTSGEGPQGAGPVGSRMSNA